MTDSKDDAQLESRRQFLASCALMAVGLASESLMGAGCGSTSTPTTGTQAIKGGNCDSNGTTITVFSSGGHTHSAPTISASDVSTGTQHQYTLGTTDSHSHTVTVTAAQFATLGGNQGISTATDANDGTGHQHSIVINCS